MNARLMHVVVGDCIGLAAASVASSFIFMLHP